MSDEPGTPSFQQGTPRWLSEWALIGAAAICLLISIALAIADRVVAGTLTAGLFVVCVLFHYLPQMESFKAYGIEAKWRVKESLEEILRAKAELEELKAQIAANASKEALVAASAKVDLQLSTANNALEAALTAIDLRTGSPRIGTPTVSTIPKSG